jgi:hypothetical protein
VLIAHIAEIADEPLVLDPDDHDAETRTNTWGLGAAPAERAQLSVEQVTTAFEGTAAALRRRVRDLGFPLPVTFYVWHDEQAGQLRCSTTSSSEHALPFGAAYTTTAALEPIVGVFLGDTEPGVVPWANLDSGRFDHEENGVLQPFLVWVRAIGQ